MSVAQISCTNTTCVKLCWCVWVRVCKREGSGSRVRKREGREIGVLVASRTKPLALWLKMGMLITILTAHAGGLTAHAGGLTVLTGGLTAHAGGLTARARAFSRGRASLRVVRVTFRVQAKSVEKESKSPYRIEKVPKTACISARIGLV